MPRKTRLEETVSKDALSKSERLKNALLFAVPDIMFRVNREGVFLEYIPTPDVPPDMAPATFVDKNISDVVPDETASHIQDHLERALQTGDMQVFEHELPTTNGSRFFESRIVAIYADQVLVIARDIADKKKAEEAIRDSEARIRAVVGNAVDGIVTIDSDGIVQSFNPAAETIFDFPAAEVIGQPVSALMSEPERGMHDGYVANYMKTGRAKILGMVQEVMGQRRDGSTFPMEQAVNEFMVGGAEGFYWHRQGHLRPQGGRVRTRGSGGGAGNGQPRDGERPGRAPVGHARGAEGKRCQKRVPGQYEPRDSHSYERHHRNDGADSRY